MTEPRTSGRGVMQADLAKRRFRCPFAWNDRKPCTVSAPCVHGLPF